MSRTTTILLVLLLMSATAPAQFSLIGEINGYALKNNSSLPDSLKPYFSDQGVRGVWATKDLDRDGKQEVIATDYANGGRVHVFEYKAPGTLELVWSSPKFYSSNPNVTPRWVRDCDLDGDGNREIIYPAGPRYTGAVYVFEYNGTDNGYGATPGQPDLILPANQFVTILTAASRFRMDRNEAVDVGDYDGDGRDEFIMGNEDSKVYILGVDGDIGGFGSWAIEGGDPAVNPENRFSDKFSGGSLYHSFRADIDGDGKKEIVNHYYSRYGFWSIDVKGANSYRYPTPGLDSVTNAKAKTQFYHEYLNTTFSDGVAYMGISPADVDGDGKQELAGIIYTGATRSSIEFYVSLVSLTKGDSGVYVWKDSSQFGLIGQKLWELAGKTIGEHWGMTAYDFDGDKKDEIYVGGSADFNVIQMKYKGTGSILDKDSYTNTIVYPGDKARYHILTYRDSLGLKRDTTFEEAPFLTKIFAGSDLDGDGKRELAISYQSIQDSISNTWYHWDTTGLAPGWARDSTKKVLNTNVINVRVLEYQGGTSGFTEETYAFVGPEEYALEQNYPNPFNPSTTIRFSLPVDKKISLVVYDMLGKEVKTLLGGQDLAKGSHSVVWDATNNAGNPVASGSYVYTLRYGNFSKSQKMMLVR